MHIVPYKLQMVCRDNHRVRVKSQNRRRLDPDTLSRFMINMVFQVQGQARLKFQGQVYIIKDDHVPALLILDEGEI